MTKLNEFQQMKRSNWFSCFFCFAQHSKIDMFCGCSEKKTYFCHFECDVYTEYDSVYLAILFWQLCTIYFYSIQLYQPVESFSQFDCYLLFKQTQNRLQSLEKVRFLNKKFKSALSSDAIFIAVKYFKNTYKSKVFIRIIYHSNFKRAILTLATTRTDKFQESVRRTKFMLTFIGLITGKCYSDEFIMTESSVFISVFL